MRFGRWPAGLLAASVLLGCETPAEPFLVEGAQRFEPPPVYHLWWELTQECAARRGAFADVQWYVVPGAQTLVLNGRTVEGYWTSGNTIVIAEAAVLRGPLVRHEMLHSLQDGAGHPREFFLGRCAGVVVCSGPCAEDAGPPPPADPATPRVSPAALEIDVEVRPASPSGGTYGGHLVTVVTARNPRSDAVIVTLPGTTFGEPGTSFEYRIEGRVQTIGGGVRAFDEGATRFAPGERKRQVFDFRTYDAVGGTIATSLAPGTYTFRGAYGGNWAPESRTVTIP